MERGLQNRVRWMSCGNNLQIIRSDKITQVLIRELEKGYLSEGSVKGV